MGVLGCCFCGYQIRYHGEPEGDVPIEHYFCSLSQWREFEEKNVNLLDHWKEITESWRCERCGSFSFFTNVVHVSGVYAPSDTISTEPMKDPIEFGPFWDDILWFEITENSTPASEVLEKFPGNLWLAKNDEELRFYKDQNRTECVGQFKRFQSPERVTVQTMSLPAFKKMLLNYNNEIDFFYHSEQYEFIKSIEDYRIKIRITRDFHRHDLVFEKIFNTGEDFTDEVVTAKIFLDGKSISDAPDDVRL